MTDSLFQVLRGRPDEVELAVVTVVLLERLRAHTAPVAPAVRRAGGWAARPGPGWRAPSWQRDGDDG